MRSLISTTPTSIDKSPFEASAMRTRCCSALGARDVVLHHLTRDRESLVTIPFLRRQAGGRLAEKFAPTPIPECAFKNILPMCIPSIYCTSNFIRFSLTESRQEGYRRLPRVAGRDGRALAASLSEQWSIIRTSAHAHGNFRRQRYSRN
jgi:hypothetical protein